MSTEETAIMPPETLEALRGSIAKWEAIVAGTGKDQGPYNFPLCLRFLLDDEGEFDGDCTGCPVKAATGKGGCLETPYEEYERMQDHPDGLEPTSEALKAAAQRELEFLKSLLPREVA